MTPLKGASDCKICLYGDGRTLRQGTADTAVHIKLDKHPCNGAAIANSATIAPDQITILDVGNENYDPYLPLKLEYERRKQTKVLANVLYITQ